MTLDIAPGYLLTTDTARLDAGRVHALLVEHCYWARHRPREHTDRLLSGGRHYGILDTREGKEEVVGYARIVTDEVTIAWLADVVVDPAHRSRGLARALIAGVVDDLAPLGLKRVLLKSSPEGRGIYEQAGWVSVGEPETWMERRADPA